MYSQPILRNMSSKSSAACTILLSSPPKRLSKRRTSSLHASMLISPAPGLVAGTGGRVAACTSAAAVAGLTMTLGSVRGGCRLPGGGGRLGQGAEERRWPDGRTVMPAEAPHADRTAPGLPSPCRTHRVGSCPACFRAPPGPLCKRVFCSRRAVQPCKASAEARGRPRRTKATRCEGLLHRQGVPRRGQARHRRTLKL